MNCARMSTRTDVFIRIIQSAITAVGGAIVGLVYAPKLGAVGLGEFLLRSVSRTC